MNRAKLFAGALILAFWLGGCSTPLPPPTATFDNIQKIRGADLPFIALGSFVRGESLPERKDKSLQIRADSLTPPNGESFSSFLRQTFEAELNGAGRLDPNSNIILSGALTRSNVSTSGSTSRGELAAIFTLEKSGKRAFEKELVVEKEWPSAFLGAVAITDASNNYTGLYPQLLSALLFDEEFLKAIRS